MEKVMKTFYVYKLTDTLTGKWYIGSRTSESCYLGELGVTYFTSSKYVYPLFKEYPSRFVKDIVVVSDDADYIIRVEADMLMFRNARDDPASYNCTNGDPEFNAKKNANLQWSNPKHREAMSRKHKELMKENWRKEQMKKAGETCRTKESLDKLSATHKELAKTEPRKVQLQRAWDAAHTPEAKLKRSESMKRVAANGGGVGRFQKEASSLHFERLKTDLEYAEKYKAALRAGWVKRKQKESNK